MDIDENSNAVDPYYVFLGVRMARLVVSARSEKVKMVLDGIPTLPMVLPPTVAGFFLLMIFGVKRPLGQLFLELFGVKIVFSWAATVIAAVAISFPLMYRAARGAFEQVDVTLIYAARTLGFSESRIFWKVILPSAMPGVLSGAILAFARGLGEFGATAMLAGNIAGKTRTLPLAIYSQVAAGKMSMAYQYVWIIVVISFLVVVLMNVLSRRDMRGRSNHKKKDNSVEAGGQGCKRFRWNCLRTGKRMHRREARDEPAGDNQKEIFRLSLDVSLNTDGGVMGILRRLRKRQSMTLKVYRRN